MDHLLIKDTINKIDEEVILTGWVRIVRDHGKITFIDLRDQTGIIQCIGENILKVTPESAVRIEGTIVKRPDNLINKKISTGAIELQIKNIEILSLSQELPLDLGKDQLDLQLPTLLDFRTLSLRHPKVNSIFKIQEAIMEGFRKSAVSLGCTEIFVPTISASSTEGGSEVFKIKYYENDAYLIQSPQLYKQMMVPVFSRVYLVSHIYRAEPSVTTRHLSESIQMDCELGFVEFEEFLFALEKIVKDTLSYVEKKHKNILEKFGVESLKINQQVPRLKMREAQNIIKERTGIDNTKEPDLSPEDEREISKWALEKYNSDLVTITHYPTSKRAFYTKPDPADPEYSLSCDLIFKGIELLSGSMRINDYDELVKAIKNRGMKTSDFEMYLQAFKYGMPPEGGFSFGLERMTMQILGLSNIREASLFPRDMERVDFRFSSKEKVKNQTKN